MRHRPRITFFWRVVNPPTRLLAGVAPWWVLVETTGRKSGKRRRTPLALGKRDAQGLWVIAVHGLHSGWVLNGQAADTIQIRHRLRRYPARLVVHSWDSSLVEPMSRYARSGTKLSAQDPVIVQFVRA